ncbi:MAG TPA: hypothetical protein VI542_38880, partial [Candidatus Tectomicrobia bacterium]
HMVAVRGEDDANPRPQRRERVPPRSPKGVSGGCPPAGPALKWRLKFLSPADCLLALLVTFDFGCHSMAW